MSGPRSVLIGLLLAGTPWSGALAAQPAAEAVGAAAAPDDRVARDVEAALALFRQRRHADALAVFERLLAEAPAGLDLATLEYDAAVCLLELGRWDEAERRFLASAARDAKLLPLAELDAGLAALRAGRLDRARRHLEAAPAGDAEVEQRRRALATRLAAADSDRRRVTRRALSHEARAKLDAGRPAEALALYRQAFALAGGEPPAARAELAYAAGVAAYRAGDFAQARTLFVEARTLAPREADFEYMAAVTALELGQSHLAEQELRAALRLGLDRDGERAARAHLTKLDPLPAPGLGGWASLGAGFDSDAEQSGLSGTTGVGGSGSGQGSAFARAAGELEWRARVSPAAQPSLFYALDALGFAASGVRDLGEQAHEAGARFAWAASRDVVLRASASASYVLAGTDAFTSLEHDYGGALRASIAHGRAARLRLEASARRVTGLGEHEYLTGARFGLRASERLLLGSAVLIAGISVRYEGIGTRIDPLTQEVADACAAACTDASWAVPLPYLAPRVDLEASAPLIGAFGVGATGAVEWRRYSAASFVRLPSGAALAGSERRREDLRFEAGARAELELGEPTLLSLGHAVLISRSNLAHDAADPEHRFDHDDRNFVQQVTTLEIETVF